MRSFVFCNSFSQPVTASTTQVKTPTSTMLVVSIMSSGDDSGSVTVVLLIMRSILIYFFQVVFVRVWRGVCVPSVTIVFRIKHV